MTNHFVLPRDLPSAVSDIEARKLEELAAGKVVLELGAHYGFSTVVLGHAAAELHSVDWHRGDAQAGWGDNLITYIRNLETHGVTEKVISHVGPFEKVVPAFKAYFDGAFIDGAHDAESVERDTLLVVKAVKKGGWIAWHDYGRFDVAPVVDRLVKAISNGKVEVFDSLAVAVKS